MFDPPDTTKRLHLFFCFIALDIFCSARRIDSAFFASCTSPQQLTMRLIINLFVLLSYCLVHGLVIPRQELTSLDDLDGLDILPCDALNSCK